MFNHGEKEYSGLSLALGFFDGVHIAHKEVILNAVDFARKNNGKSAVITFNNHPTELLGRNVEYINTLQERDDIIKSFGVDYVFSLDFDEKLLNTTCDEYLQILVEKFAPISITTGFNHTFGKSGCGNPEFLEQNQHKYGYKYFQIPPMLIDGEVVSSSLIRKKLLSGDVIGANKLLGREFFISGEVIKGNQIGTKIGFPTANISYPEKIVKLPFGVYSANVEIDGITHKAILNYGVKPTVNGSSTPVAEVHILEFNRDIYGEKIKIYVNHMIRGEKKFESLDALKNQIIKDIQAC